MPVLQVEFRPLDWFDVFNVEHVDSLSALICSCGLDLQEKFAIFALVPHEFKSVFRVGELPDERYSEPLLKDFICHDLVLEGVDDL